MKICLAAMLMALVAPNAHASQPETVRLVDGREVTIVVIDKPDIRRAALKLFNDGLKKLGTSKRIQDCELLVDEPAGTAHGNHSYGGVCTLTNDKEPTVLICADEMIGHFTIAQPYYLLRGISSLAGFIADNCVGG